MREMDKSNSKIKVYLLPAGKGDFIIIQYEDFLGEHSIFIDGGDRATALIYKDALEKVKKQSKSIDALIFTHSDDDHISGALCAMTEMDELPEIKRIFLNTGEHIKKRFCIEAGDRYPETERKGYLKKKSNTHSIKQAMSMMECLKEHNLEEKIHSCVCMGDCIKIGEAVLKIVSPSEKELRKYLFEWDKEEKTTEKEQHDASLDSKKQDLSCYVDYKIKPDNSISNGSCIAFLFEYAGSCIAFLGDGYATVCQTGIKRFYPSGKNVDAVKIPHHGSEYNYTDELYQLLKTEYYLLSTKGTDKHPSPVFLGKLFDQNSKAKILCNGKWMFRYGFSMEDMKRYLNKDAPRIYQVQEVSVSSNLTILGMFDG